jgi:hypothetical protein
MELATENLEIKKLPNDSQGRLGVKPDKVEQSDTSGGDIEYQSKEVVHPCHMVFIHGATTSERQV